MKCDSASVEGSWIGKGIAVNRGALSLGNTVELHTAMCINSLGEMGVVIKVCNAVCETGYSSSASMYGLIGDDCNDEDECVMNVVETEGAGTYKFCVDEDSISYILTQPADFYGYGNYGRRLVPQTPTQTPTQPPTPGPTPDNPTPRPTPGPSPDNPTPGPTTPPGPGSGGYNPAAVAQNTLKPAGDCDIDTFNCPAISELCPSSSPSLD